MELTSNISDTALVLEGGGMRGAFTAAIVTTLLGEGMHFDYVAGISAGSSNLANYVSRAAVRARRCFVDFAANPQFGTWKTWLQGKGLFNAEFIYERTYLPDGPLPFDFDSFMANPARVRIGAYDTVLGETVYWSRDDIHVPLDLMHRVRASSSIPLVMPPVTVDGRLYVDGALGLGGGIPLPVAQRDGFSKFFVVLTRGRDYVKPASHGTGFFRALFPRHPAIAAGVRARPARYNAMREELFELERQGRAIVVYPDLMIVDNQTRDVAALRTVFDAGLAQSRRELPRWKEFLGMD